MKLILTAFALALAFIAAAQPPVLKIPTAHTAWITGFDISHNGRYVATSSVDFTVKIWDYRTKKELRVLTGHKGSVNAVLFSPDDKWVASAGNDASIRIWELSTGKCLFILDSLFNRVINDICFSEDGKLIAGCSNNGIGVYDLSAKKTVEKFYNAAGIRIKFFPGSYKLACSSADSMLSVYNRIDTFIYVENESFRYVHGPIKDFFFSKDGKFMVTAVNTGINNIRFHIIGGKDSLRLQGHLQMPRAVCPGETDNEFYSMALRKNAHNFREDIEIRKWSISARKCIDSFYLSDGIFSTSANSLKKGSQQDLLLSNDRSLFFVKNDLRGVKDKISSRTTIANGLSDQANLLEVTAEDGIIRSFDRAYNRLETLNTHSYFVDAKFNGDKNLDIIHRLISGNDYNSYIVRHDLRNNHSDTLVSEKGYIAFQPGVCVSPDGSRIAYKLIPVKNGKFITDSSKFKIWDNSLSKFIRVSRAAYISDLKFLPDNRSYILCTNLSNSLSLYHDTTEIIYRDTVIGKYDFYTHLEVLDSIHVIASDNRGITIWNLQTHKIERKVSVFPKEDIYVQPVYLCISPNKDRILLGQNDTVRLVDLHNYELLQTFTADMGWVHHLAFSSDTNMLITASIDNSIRFWDIKTGKEKYKMIFIDSSDWIIVSPEGYYQCTSPAAKQLHYVTADNRIITFDQLDTKYNRPDKILQAMDNKDTLMIRSYKRAWQKRMKKLGVDTTAFRSGYSAPDCDFTDRDKMPYEQKQSRLLLHITGNDNSYKLKTFNVWINDVPVYGQRGIRIGKNRNSFDTTITVTLSEGENKIVASVANINGTESFRMPIVVNYVPATRQKVTAYFIGIGIDKFANSEYDLQYSSKDIRQLAAKLKEKYGEDLVVDTLFNTNVTVARIKALKKRLLTTTVNDKVIIAYSGHGLLSKDFDYYLSTYSVNFVKPEQNGLPYDELEDLLDSIPARKKIMLIDACHSGEVDKDELVRINKASDSLKLTKGGITVAYGDDPNHLGIKNSFELMQNLFVNVGKSTGATIISAAGGTQFALERGDLKNGVFTYSILEAMEKNPTMRISELKRIVGERVVELTNGRQKPTSRNENIAVDWEL